MRRAVSIGKKSSECAGNYDIKRMVGINMQNPCRTMLEDAIPLSSPFSITLDISSLCDLKCSFCFHATEYAKQMKKQHMTWNLFEKIINGMKDFPSKLKKINFGQFGEPLLNPRIVDMVKYAKDSDVAETIEIYTNAISLTPDMSEGLISSGLDKLSISVEAMSANGYKEIAGREIDFDIFIKNIQHFSKTRASCYLYIKIADIAIKTKYEEDAFYRAFKDISDMAVIEHIDRLYMHAKNDESEKGVYGTEKEEKNVCPLIFHRFSVYADGVAVPCCMDWTKAYPIGDANTQTVSEIWNSEKLRELQLSHLHGNRKTLHLCNDCNLIKSTFDNIDRYADNLAEKMRSL
jgi:radical SAM protein with 4Fe4S-binding SPASM domain